MHLIPPCSLPRVLSLVAPLLLTTFLSINAKKVLGSSTRRFHFNIDTCQFASKFRDDFLGADSLDLVKILTIEMPIIPIVVAVPIKHSSRQRDGININRLKGHAGGTDDSQGVIL
jgi:hypothetical protein